jgi:hypothetical protein
MNAITHEKEREKILNLEREIQKLPQAECPVKNIFCNGVYAREMFIPAGVVASGAVHKTEHISIVSKGRILLMTDDGVQEITAPYIGTSSAGIKRVAYAIEDTIITTFHATQETDIEKVIEELTESTLSELIGGNLNVQMNNNLIGG